MRENQQEMKPGSLTSRLALCLWVAIAASSVPGCAGGEEGPSAEERISEYVGIDVTSCAETGDVRAGLPVLNCGFTTGKEGCFTVLPDDEPLSFIGVKQYSGGPNCPDALDSVEVAASVDARQDGFDECKGQSAADVGLPPTATKRQIANQIALLLGSLVQDRAEFLEGCLNALRTKDK